LGGCSCTIKPETLIDQRAASWKGKSGLPINSVTKFIGWQKLPIAEYTFCCLLVMLWM
jgi:hypothetical protein